MEKSFTLPQTLTPMEVFTDHSVKKDNMETSFLLMRYLQVIENEKSGKGILT